MSLNDDIFDIGDLGFDEDQKEQATKIKDENPEKQKYINDNIIAKGYNLEDLSRSITVRTGLTINEISLDTLKREVEFYKTQQLKESYKMAKEMKSSKGKKSEGISDSINLNDNQTEFTNNKNTDIIYSIKLFFTADNISFVNSIPG